MENKAKVIKFCYEFLNGKITYPQFRKKLQELDRGFSCTPENMFERYRFENPRCITHCTTKCELCYRELAKTMLKGCVVYE